MAGLEFSRNQKLALCAVIGVLAMGLSIAHINNSRSEGDILFQEPGSSDSAQVITSDSDQIPELNNEANQGKVIFQVAGCVKSPGVYSLPYGSRIYQAIKAAGGSGTHADTQSLNLAEKIRDGSRIYVPAIGESAGASPQSAGSTNSSSAQSSAARPAANASGPVGDKLTTPGQGVVHINSASLVELQRLPGVGPSTAQKIVDYRAKSGPFRTPEQLDEVSGIGPKKWEKMKPFVAL